MKYISSLNSVTLEGNFFRDPVFRFDEAEGKDVCDLRIASSFYPNENEKEVSYITVRCYEKNLMKAVENYGEKGRGVRITGRLREERGEGNPDAAKSRLVIVANNIEFRSDFGK
jgi:single-strand DNA-binding protein